MSAPGRSASLLFSTFFGLVMVLAAAGTSRGAAWIGAVIALAAVLAGLFHRVFAAVAVLATAGVLAWSGAPVLVAAGCGLSATAYLVSRFRAALTGPTVLGMAAFSLVALAAALVPWRPAWVPLLAPVIVVGIVVLAGAGLFREDTARYE